MRQASARVSEAQRLLAAFRDRGENDLREAYCAVRAATCDLAAVRHWRALEAMTEDMRRGP